jgi:hypothetical protein
MTQSAQEPGITDIHNDLPVLYMLRTQRIHSSATTAAQIRRITRRARGYRFINSNASGHTGLFRVMQNGTLRQVPPPPDRAQIVLRAHELSGHFGVRRTMHLLLQTYWWQRIMADVTSVVNNCTVCNRTKASFNSSQPSLHPLEICGLFYRWGVDLCGPFPTTPRGHKYIMVMIEHFSKLLVLEPLTAKEAKCTCYAFEHGVLGRFGACAEVVTDQGSEFLGEFQAMLARCFIDHRTTSPGHPQANGAAERCVQTVKRCLRRHCEDSASTTRWDLFLPYISMGYNSSKQMSTNCSPFQLLYARDPVFSSSVQQHFKLPIDFDLSPTADAAATTIRTRAAYLREAMPVIANNLAIAQHRDRLRYAMTRSGTYLPKLRKFVPGDYVYLRRAKQVSTLQIPARETILRVLEVRDNGVLLLQGRCGLTTTAHHSELAPCHLPHIDGTIDSNMAMPAADHACEVCHFPDNDDLMLICDGCTAGWHTYCLTPPLSTIPAGKWVCPYCTSNGITAAQLEHRSPSKPQHRHPERSDTIFPNPASRARDKAAEQYDGWLIARTIGGRRNNPDLEWGTLTYNGADSRPKYFTATFTTGTPEQLTMHQVLGRPHKAPGDPTPHPL